MARRLFDEVRDSGDRIPGGYEERLEVETAIRECQRVWSRKHLRQAQLESDQPPMQDTR